MQPDTSNLIYMVGFLVVTSFGSIVTAIVFTIRKVVAYAKLEFRVEQMEKDINAQFAVIRSQNEKISDLQEIKGSLEGLVTILRDDKTK